MLAIDGFNTTDNLDSTNYLNANTNTFVVVIVISVDPSKPSIVGSAVTPPIVKFTKIIITKNTLFNVYIKKIVKQFCKLFIYGNLGGRTGSRTFTRIIPKIYTNTGLKTLKTSDPDTIK